MLLNYKLQENPLNFQQSPLNKLEIILHRPKRKMRQNSIKKIKILFNYFSNDVNSPRRALYYLTTTTYYDCSG